MENFKLNPPSPMIDQREWEVSQIFDKERLKQRWQEIQYTPPKGKQLKLF